MAVEKERDSIGTVCEGEATACEGEASGCDMYSLWSGGYPLGLIWRQGKWNVVQVVVGRVLGGHT